jgi:hypothetical protein
VVQAAQAEGSTLAGGQTYQVADAGTVTVGFDGRLVSAAAETNAGWTAWVEHDDDGREAKVWFQNGSRLLRLEAELEDGRLDVEIDDRSGHGGDEDDHEDDDSRHGGDD